MKNKTSQKGFTIIETLVAITILMIAVVGPLTIAHKGLIAAVYARDQITASYLAQDAIEFIKNVKENNLRNELPWLSGFEGACSAIEAGKQQAYCVIDTVNGQPIIRSGITTGDVPSCDACALYTSDNGYVPNGSGRPVFYRSVYIVTQPSDEIKENEATIIVKVWWKNGTIQNETIYESEMFKVTR